MAVVIDLVTTASSNATTSLTWSHTCSGEDRGLWIAVSDQSNSNLPTYNGTSFTSRGNAQNLVAPGNPSVRTAYMVNAPSGAHDVVATNTYTENMCATTISVTGVSQSISTPAYLGATGTSTAPSVTATGNSTAGLFVSGLAWTNSTGAATVDNSGGSTQSQQSQMAMSVISGATGAGASINGSQSLAWTLPTSVPWTIAYAYLTPTLSVTVALSGQSATTAIPTIVAAGQSLTGQSATAAVGVLQTAITPGPVSTTVTVTTTGAGSFTIPADVSSITFEGWGGGGGGGVRTACEAGGGGGAYARTVYSVTPTQVVYFTVPTGGGPGAVGGAAWANLGTNSQTGAGLIADYGRNGSTSTTTGGAAGLASNSTGDVKFDGGGGRAAQSGTSGLRAGSGGGGGAGSAGAGQLGGIGSSNVVGSGGVAGTPDGGTGGAGGVSSANGVTGTAPAGGGGGGGNVGGNAGSGARGQIKYTYSTPTDVGNRTLSLAGQGTTTAQAGSVTPSITDPGTVVALSATQYGASAYGTLGKALDKALTGLSATGQHTLPTPLSSRTPLGQTASAEQGSFGVALSVGPLLGQSAASAAGQFASVGTAIVLSGQAATSAAGSVEEGISLALTSALAASAVGAFAQHDHTANVAGQEAIAAIGDTNPDNAILLALTGVELVSQAGLLVPDRGLLLVGQPMPSGFKAPTPVHDLPCTGQQAALSYGQVGVQIDLSIELLGQAMGAASGAITPLGTVGSVLAGQFAVGENGALGISRQTLLGGVEAAAQAQSLAGQQLATFALAPSAAMNSALGATKPSSSMLPLGQEVVASAPASVSFTTAATLAGQSASGQTGLVTAGASPNRGATLQGVFATARQGAMLRLDTITGHRLSASAGRLTPVVSVALAADPFGSSGFGEGGYFVPDQAPVAADAADVSVSLVSLVTLFSQSVLTLNTTSTSTLQGLQAPTQNGSVTAQASNSVALTPAVALQSAVGAVSTQSSVTLNGLSMVASVGFLERSGLFAGVNGQSVSSAAGSVVPVISTDLLLGGQAVQTTAGALGTGALQFMLTGQSMQSSSDADLGVEHDLYLALEVPLTGGSVDGETGRFPGGVVISVTPQGLPLILMRGNVRPRIFTAENFAIGDARTVVVPIQILGVEVPIEMNSYTQGVSP